MPTGLIILIALLGIPILEIAVFIALGGEIGIAWTLALIFITAVIGTFLLRMQGLSLINRIRQETEAGRVPGRELGHGAMLLVAGILLLTPGFVTDGIGFLLFVPAFRDLLWRVIRSRLDVTVIQPGAQQRPPPRGKGPTIDLGSEEFRRGPDPSSPWHDDPEKG